MKFNRPTSILAVLVAGVLSLAATACGGHTSVKQYQISLEQKQISEPNCPETRNKQLTIELFNSSSAYDESRIAYRKSPYRINYYYYHRWVVPPNMMLTDLLREGFAETNCFAGVNIGYKHARDLIVGGRVLRFEEVDVSEQKWTANLKVDIWLRRVGEDAVVWQQIFDIEVPVPKHSPEQVTKALSEAANRVLSDSLEAIIRAVPEQRGPNSKSDGENQEAGAGR